MKDIDATQAVLALHLLNCMQHLRQTLPRYGGIHAHVVGADPARGGKSVLTAAPKFEALRFVGADFDSRCPGADENLFHPNNLFGHLLGTAVAFAQQNGGGVEVVISVYERFNRGGHGLVHEFEARRYDAARDYTRYRSA